MKLEVGDEVDQYRIVRQLGQGGMGAVYEVEHAKLFRQRFLAEGKVLARLNHPNIARVFDLNYDDEVGVAYFVMDLVHYKDGESYTLADLETGGADEDHLIKWFSQMASALDYIHNEGIIHRDIKLNNILLNDKGGVTLSDFGISRFVGDRIRKEVDVAHTIVSMGTKQVTGNFIMGTEGYMGPEIQRGEAATAASDTYALGITFFRLLTGIWYEPGTDALKLLEPFDSAWMEILPRMLEADPKKRPTNLTVLADKLKSSVTTGSLSTIRTKIVQTPYRRRPRRQALANALRPKLPWLGLGAAAAIALSTGAWFRENPANWSRDRYGAVTSHYLGNLELLNRPRIAFVASQGFFASGLRPRRVWRRALLISPQATGSRLNKKVATWCNEYVLRHADEIWVGDLSPNGMLSSMLHSMNRL